MDYEKAYKELTDYIDLLSHGALTAEQHEIVDMIRKKIPVKEIEDEKIREKIIKIVELYYGETTIEQEKQEKKDILAWLEKQKEQKTAEWSEDWREEDIQTRFAFYTYKDDSSILYLSNVFVEETSRNHGFGTKILVAAEKVAETIGAITIRLKVKQDSPANAWYRKNGYGYFTFEGEYDWLEKNLEYMKHNKQEWSEGEREDRVRDIVAAVNNFYDEQKAKELIDFLKLLYRGVEDEYGQEMLAVAYKAIFDNISPEKRTKEINDSLAFMRQYTGIAVPQPHWKPSEEQMKALWDAYNGGKEQEPLRELIEQLKKLI